MYEQYSKETQDKIKELGLWGKEPKEIIKEAIKACDRMDKDIERKGIKDSEAKEALGVIKTFLLEYMLTL